MKYSYLPLVAAHADQHVDKFLKAWRVSSVSKLGVSVVHDVFSGPLRNLFSTQHQLQLLWSERTKLLHRKHRVKPVWKINIKLKISYGKVRHEKLSLNFSKFVVCNPC